MTVDSNRASYYCPRSLIHQSISTIKLFLLGASCFLDNVCPSVSRSSKIHINETSKKVSEDVINKPKQIVNNTSSPNSYNPFFLFSTSTTGDLKFEKSGEGCLASWQGCYNALRKPAKLINHHQIAVAGEKPAELWFLLSPFICAGKLGPD